MVRYYISTLIKHIQIKDSMSVIIFAYSEKELSCSGMLEYRLLFSCSVVLPGPAAFI